MLAAATLAGSLVALLANPIAGALSDRSRSRWGPRRPWMLAGALLAGLSILVLPQAKGGIALLLLWCSAKLGLNACLAALNGAVADRVPDAQQGLLWGWVGLAQPLGLVLGVGLSTLLLPQLQLAAFCQSALVVVCCLPVLLVVGGQPARARAVPAAAAPLTAFRYRSFRGLWWSRFWLYLRWSMSTVYLLHFLEDRLGLARAEALQAPTLQRAGPPIARASGSVLWQWAAWAWLAPAA